MVIYDITLVVPGGWENVPEGKEFLDLKGRNSTTRHPVLDSWNVQNDFSLEINSMSWTPVSDMFDVPAEDVFSVGCDNDPPKIKGELTREDGSSDRDFEA